MSFMKSMLRNRLLMAVWALSCNMLLQAQSVNTLLLEEKTDVIVRDDGSFTHHESQVYRIFNEHGADYASKVMTYGQNSKLLEFSAVVTDGNGKVIRKFKKNDLKETELSRELASDTRTYYLDYTPHQYPVMIAFHVVSQYNDGCLTYPIFCPQSDYNLEVAHASYQITVPKHLKCRTFQQNTEIPLDVSEDAEGRQVIRAEVNQLPAIVHEPLMPDFNEIAPAVYFAPTQFSYAKTKGTMESWESLGSWLYSLQQGRQTLPELLKTKLHEMTDSCTSIYSRVNEVYKYLGETTRYVSIQYGIGGLQPFSTADVARTGFGDCKALSNYMVAMLAEVGVPAYYTVIGTKNRRVFKNFANVGQFNHVIVMVPQASDTIWIECTDPSLPLGYVHQDIAGHDALVVTKNGGHLVSLPVLADSLNRQETHVKADLSADGHASLTLEQHSYNRQYEELRPLLRKTDEAQRVYFKKMLTTQAFTIKEKNISESISSFGQPVLDLECKGEDVSLATVTGKRLFIGLLPLHCYLPVLDDEKRNNDICIYDGYFDDEKIELHIPKGYEIEALPQTTNIKTDFGSSKMSVKMEGDSLYVQHEFRIHKGRYTKEQYNDFHSFIKEARRPYNQRIVFIRKE